MTFSDQELRYLSRSIDFQQAVWMNTPLVGCGSRPEKSTDSCLNWSGRRINAEFLFASIDHNPNGTG